MNPGRIPGHPHRAAHRHMDQPVPIPAQAPPRPEPPARRSDPGRWRLGALLAGAVLLPALIMAVAGRNAWHSTWEEAERELAVAAEATSEFVLRLVEGHGRIAARIAESLDGETDDAILAAESGLRAGLMRFIADLPLARGVVVTGAGGRVLVQATLPPGSGGGTVDLARAGLASAGRGLQVSAAFLPWPGAPPVLAIVQDRAGGAGSVAILLDANGTGAGMGRILREAEDSTALLRSDGQILARHPGFRAPPPPLAAGMPLMVALVAGRNEGRLDGQTPRDGRPVLVRFRRIDAHPELVVATARPRDAVVQRWQRVMAPLLGLGLPAMLALAGLSWLVRGKQRALEATLARLEQRVAERTASLREGEERLRLAVGAARMGTWETDLDTGLTTRSPLALQIMGMPAEAAQSGSRDWSDRIHPQDRGAADRSWQDMAAGRAGEQTLRYRFLHPDGSWRWLESAATVVRADPATGRPRRIAGTVQDITERREAEERRELLTQEVNHRARNTLAIVQAILRLTRAEDAAGYARLVEGRIAALARAQSLLAAERWTGAPLRTVLTEELAPFGGTDAEEQAGRGRFALSGTALRLRAEAVQPLGIVFHELATNAAKHGALSVPQGRVDVSWQEDEAAGLLRIRWAESGGPTPGLPKHRGVGSRVMEATIGGQLGGRIDRRWPAEGMVCEIAVPLARVRAGPA